MTHVIYAFDRSTEALIFEVPILAENIEQLRAIMKWNDAENELYGYDLDFQQLAQLEALTGRSFYDPQYDYQLASYGN
ncbi:hypothetical protein [Pseudomonas sp. MWU12-3103b]|uniref:DUF7683 domain-containing protein n=1 Tax=unclassified Pseudomonas TaxID=196821 RepID=UPI000E27C1B9|nr:hypothetical protein [Pseudomonas sp. MWU12-3103b]